MPTLTRRRIFNDQPDVTTAIQELRPGASFAVEYANDGDHYATLQWYPENEQLAPTRTEVDAKLAEQKAAWEAQSYARNRFVEYPYLEVQFGMLYDDIEAGKFGEDAKTGKWFTAMKAVKDKYPKPAEG